MTRPVPIDEAEFHLCLTHDVDRLSKTFQRPYQALTERSLRPLYRGRKPYWQFDTIRALETDLGVRSSFYFLSERRLFTETSPGSWLHPRHWILYTGRYDLSRPGVRRVITDLHRGGWEVGLHGSYTSYLDRDRLQYEKQRLEAIVGGPVVGGRQHYLNLERPETWRLHREIGLRYDSTLGSSRTYGFQNGYDVLRPFDDSFVVFPLTLMDNALMQTVADVEEAERVCDSLLVEAREHGAVMTIDWHQRVFNETEFPGYRSVYEYLIRRALELGAWAGPCLDLYEWFTDESSTAEASGAITRD